MPGNDSTNYNSNKKNFCRHPCFNNYDFHHAMIHLPVAGEYNVFFHRILQEKGQLSGICGENSSELLTPYEAVDRVQQAQKSIPNLTVAAIAGPGEVLADFESAKETLRLIRQSYPQMLLCLATNGLMLPVYAYHLISLGVNYVTVNMHTISPETGDKLYDHITYLGRHYTGIEGANILLQNQISGMSYLSSMGISVRMNILVMKDVNEQEICDMVYLAKECGCKMTNIVLPSMNNKDDFNGLNTYSNDEIGYLRRECEKIMPQSYFCKPCNSATVETLNTRFAIDFRDPGKGSAVKLQGEVPHYRFAVCSKTGILIDEHFGHATNFYIYDVRDGFVTFLETRPTEQYAQGTKEDKAAGRVYKLIKAIEDCNCVVCMRIGACPSDALREKNIDIYTTYNLIEDGLKEAVLRLYTGPAVNL